jgi:hypothetical protein
MNEFCGLHKSWLENNLSLLFERNRELLDSTLESVSLEE